MTVTISRTELARNTRKTIERARREGPVLVESYGEEQVALLDIIDFRLLRAVAAWQPDPAATFSNPDALPAGLVLEEPGSEVTHADVQALWDRVLAAYLDVNISLGRAAELLELSRFEFQARMNRLGLPLRLGPATIEEAQKEVEALRNL